MEDNTIISLVALSVALLCLMTEAVCSIFAPQCAAVIQHPADVLMGGCLGVIMGATKKGP